MWSPELKIWVCHCLSCQISDLRNQVYLENGLDLLPGEGQVVGRQIRKPLDKMEHGGEPGPEAELGGGAAVQDKLQVASTIAHSHTPQAKASNAFLAGSRITAKKFLNRLPKCVIQGEVIDIRGSIRDTLQVRPALVPPASSGDFIINPGPAC